MPTRLDRAYQSAITRLRERLEALLRRQFHAAGDYRDADADRFVAQMVPLVLAARAASSSLTAGWLSQKLTDALGRTVRAAMVDTTGLRGVPVEEVYRRPFRTVWAELSEGRPLAQATEAGEARAADLVLSDIQLAKTHTAREVFQQAGVDRYIRVLKGEQSCALCYVASTQTYSTSTLSPMHPGCDCDVDIAPPDFDGTDQLAASHEAIQERFGVSDPGARAPDYRKALLVREHGELGPVLTVAEHRFTTEAAL